MTPCCLYGGCVVIVLYVLCVVIDPEMSALLHE